MAVNGNKTGSNHIKRLLFDGDVASMWTPETNPEPTTARGRRRRQNGKAKRKAPGELIKGLAHRPHTHPKDVPSPMIKGHSINANHAKLVPLTKAYKNK